MPNPLQDQLLKAGLVKKSQVAQVAHAQAKQRKAGAASSPTAEQRDAARARDDRVARDRALAAERNAQARVQEAWAQARQIVETQRIATAGDIAYRFVDGAAIRSVQVDAAQRAQLATGALLVVRIDDTYALLPRAAADKVRERDAAMIVVDHSTTAASADEGDARFAVPDDLIW